MDLILDLARRCRTFALAMMWLLLSGWQFALGCVAVCTAIGAGLLPWAELLNAAAGALIGLVLYLAVSYWIVDRSSAQ